VSRWPPLQAVLFDMDGTLIDSEYLTERAVSEVFARYHVPVDVLERLDLGAFHGVAWPRIASSVCDVAPELATQASHDTVQAQLQASFHAGLLADDPHEIAGAVAAVTAAAAQVGVALVSSSDRASVEHVVARLGLRELLEHRICAEDCERTKPAPEGYLKAAALLGVPPASCLVFEDSVAGLAAARAAGMRTVAIVGSGFNDGALGAGLDALIALADEVIADYTALPPDFFRTQSAP
jgi:mannitol-1-/sugar-/sorbitol-6-phosphatase